MFEGRSGELFQRALHHPTSYKRRILAQALRQMQNRTGQSGATILTQPEVRRTVQAQFTDPQALQVVFPGSLEREAPVRLEQGLPKTEVVIEPGDGQAMDTVNALARNCARPLQLAPPIVSVDTAVTSMHCECKGASTPERTGGGKTEGEQQKRHHTSGRRFTKERAVSPVSPQSKQIREVL